VFDERGDRVLIVSSLYITQHSFPGGEPLSTNEWSMHPDDGWSDAQYVADHRALLRTQEGLLFLADTRAAELRVLDEVTFRGHEPGAKPSKHPASQYLPSHLPSIVAKVWDLAEHQHYAEMGHDLDELEPPRGSDFPGVWPMRDGLFFSFHRASARSPGRVRTWNLAADLGRLQSKLQE
jgi:hypothetical protein